MQRGVFHLAAFGSAFLPWLFLANPLAAHVGWQAECRNVVRTSMPGAPCRCRCLQAYIATRMAACCQNSPQCFRLCPHHPKDASVPADTSCNRTDLNRLGPALRSGNYTHITQPMRVRAQRRDATVPGGCSAPRRSCQGQTAAPPATSCRLHPVTSRTRPRCRQDRLLPKQSSR